MTMFPVDAPILIIIALLIVSLHCVIADEKSPTEYSLIRAGIEANKALRTKNDSSAKKNLLCVVFMQSTLQPLVTLYANMGIMKTSCDWALVMYGGDVKYESIICSDNNFVGNIVHCKRASAKNLIDIDIDDPVVIRKACAPVVISEQVMNSLLPNSTDNVKRNSPKSLLYREILPYLTKYKRVMMLDEDISLVGFNATTSLEIWDCAFSPPPLIVQPLVYESRQYYPFLGLKYWQRWSYASAATGLIEQQVPMFESNFLSWFVNHVLNKTVGCAASVGVEWGMDRTWCNAAKDYGKEVLGWSKYQNPCALIIGTSSVHHLDTRSIKSKRSDPAVFRARGSIIVQKYVNTFPEWFTTRLDSINPLERKNAKKFPRAKKNEKSCVAKRALNCVYPFC